MGKRTFWKVLLVNAAFAMALQFGALVVSVGTSSTLVREFWMPAEFSVDPDDTGHGLGENSTLSNFSVNIPLPEGNPTRLRVSRVGTEVGDAIVFICRYELPFVLAALTLIFLTLFVAIRLQARRVSAILKRVQSGERGAKFPDSLLGPNHPVSVAFNQLVGKIENQIDELRKSEMERARVLGELAGDLQEPYAMLRASFAAVATEPSIYAVAAARQELDYFEVMLDELLLLARLHAPGYQSPSERVDIQALAQAEISRVNQRRSAKIKATLQVSFNANTEVEGCPRLLQRLLRNAIDNAVFYARTEVQVHLISLEGELEICVRDNGKGYTDDALSRYGTRRNARYLEARQAGKAFSGLGSIVLLSIAASHGGSASPGNWYHPSGDLGGGEVRILLPSRGIANRRKSSALLAAA